MFHKMSPCAPLLCFLAVIGLLLSACEAPAPVPTPVVDLPTITEEAAISMVLERFPVRKRPLFSTGMSARYMRGGNWEAKCRWGGSWAFWEVSEWTGRALPLNDAARYLEAQLSWEAPLLWQPR